MDPAAPRTRVELPERSLPPGAGFAAAVLYFTGAFSGRSIFSETDCTNIRIHAPASPPAGGGTAPGRGGR